MTPFGFFSIVQKPEVEQAGTLTIRARVRADLERLRKTCLPGMDAIVANAGSDYRYRARAPRAEVASAMAKIASDIHCANFKDDVAKEQGKVRAGFYGKVWEVLYSLPDQTAPAVGMPAATSAGGLTAAFGGVLVDDQGRFLLRGPTDTTVDTSGRLSMTTNAVGRKRDLAVLKSAVQFMQRQAG